MGLHTIHAALAAGNHLHFTGKPHGIISVSLSKQEGEYYECEDVGVALGHIHMNFVAPLPVDDNPHRYSADEIIGLFSRINEWLHVPSNMLEAWRYEGHIFVLLFGFSTVCIPTDVLDFVTDTGREKLWETERGYMYLTSLAAAHHTEPTTTVVTERPLERDELYDFKYLTRRIGCGGSLLEAIESALKDKAVEIIA